MALDSVQHHDLAARRLDRRPDRDLERITVRGSGMATSGPVSVISYPRLANRHRLEGSLIDLDLDPQSWAAQRRAWPP